MRIKTKFIRVKFLIRYNLMWKSFSIVPQDVMHNILQCCSLSSNHADEITHCECNFNLVWFSIYHSEQILHKATLNSKANRPQFSHFSWHYFKRVGMESKFSTSMIGFHIHTAQIHLVFNSRFTNVVKEKFMYLPISSF